MTKLFIVLAQEQKTVSHFRQLEKTSRIFAIFEIHLTKQATRNETIKSIALL